VRPRPLARAATYAFLIVAALLMIAPFLWSISTSLKQPGDVFAYPPKLLPDPVTFQNYIDVFTKLTFDRYFLNSVIVTGSVVLLNVLFGTAAAYAFAKLRFPGRNAIFFLLLLTLMVPFQVNLIPLYKIMVELHKAIPAIGADTYFGIVAPSAIQVFGIFLMRQFLRAVPDEILESARMDGASELLAIFTFLGAWNDFLWPLIVTNSDEMRTMPVGLALLARKNASNWGDTMAGTVLTAAPLIVMFLILQRRFIEGLTAGSVKDVG
jgi:ABC-type glycerol-3-phosphate transport system permease component